MGPQSAACSLKRPALDDSLVPNTYFIQSDKLKKTMSNQREVNPQASKNREEIIKLLRDQNQSALALNFMENSLVNKKSQEQAETRIKSYKICMTESGRSAWPPTYESLFEFVSASVCCPKPYACIDIICSDVMAAYPKFDPQDRARINNVMSRLRKKGIIGQKKQKKPLSLAMIATLRSKDGEPERKIRCNIRAALLLAFYGAFRSKECEALVPATKGKKPQFGYIGMRYDDEDGSLHADLSSFIQKGGPKCSRHVRIYCGCHSGDDGKKNNLLCLICNKDLRKAVEGMTSGFKLKYAVDFLVKSLGSDQCEDQLAPHSCRIGQAVHMFLNDIPAFADAHLAKEEQKALGTELDVFCSVVDLGNTHQKDVPGAKLISDTGNLIRQRDLHIEGPKLVKLHGTEKFINAGCVNGKYGQLIQTARGPVLLNNVKTFRIELQSLTTDNKKLDEKVAELLETSHSLRIGPNDADFKQQIEVLQDEERERLDDIANGVLDNNGNALQMPQPTYRQQMNTLTVLARGEYSGRCQQWFNTTFPVLLEGKVTDLKRDLQTLKTQEDFKKEMKASFQKGGGGKPTNKNRPEPYNKTPGADKKGKGKDGGKKGGDDTSVRAAMPRMCVPWAWGMCPHSAEDCNHPHERVTKEECKQMSESRMLGPRLRGLKYEDIPTEVEMDLHRGPVFAPLDKETASFVKAMQDEVKEAAGVSGCLAGTKGCSVARKFKNMLNIWSKMQRGVDEDFKKQLDSHTLR
eukprot:g8399.t1